MSPLSENPDDPLADRRQWEQAVTQNRRTYDAMAAANAPLCRPATDAELQNPLKTVDPLGWLGGSIAGWQVLCLAAGGGRQSMLYAAAGAHVTVVDISPAMLQRDRIEAQQRQLELRLIETSMDSLSMLANQSFDAVIHPVSTCYLPDVSAVFREVARVTRPGGLYVSQHKTPTSLQTSAQRVSGEYVLQHRYYREQPIPAPPRDNNITARLREPGAIEYLHRWEQLVGGICRSGFAIEDLVEPFHAKGSQAEADSGDDSFANRAQYVAPYVRIKARRASSAAAAPQLIL